MKITTALPQSQQVAEWIRGEIRAGRIRPGERLESIRQLAERFNVSRQVVLSAFDRLAEEKYLDKKVGCGTFVRSLPGNRKRFAFHVHKGRVSWHFYRQLFIGCAEVAEENGVELLLPSGEEGFDLVAWCREAEPDALLLSGDLDDEVIRQLNALDFPYVVLGNYQLTVAPYHVAESDFYRKIGDAVSQLLAGHSGAIPGALLGEAHTFSVRQIIGAMSEAARRGNVELLPENCISPDEEDGYAGMTELMARETPPDLLFITARAFPGAARYLHEHRGIRPWIISSHSGGETPLYPELVDICLTDSSVELGRRGTEYLLSHLVGRN